MKGSDAIRRLTPDDTDLAKQLFLFYQEDDGVTEPVLPSHEYIARLLAKEDFHGCNSNCR